LSYALSHDLPKAEEVLRRAAAHQPVDPRVRQNLALVVGLEGHFADAESIARADLPADEAAANVAYLRQMLAQKGSPQKSTVQKGTVQKPLANARVRPDAGHMANGE
jgi:Flp pilus assembly protein TadD